MEKGDMPTRENYSSKTSGSSGGDYYQQYGVPIPKQYERIMPKSYEDMFGNNKQRRF